MYGVRYFIVSKSVSFIGLHFWHGLYPSLTASSSVWKNTLFSFFIFFPLSQSSLPNIFPGFQPAKIPGSVLVIVLLFFRIL